MLVEAEVTMIGLPRHPDPARIADRLEAVAKALRTNGSPARKLAAVLAARGWPAGTLGDGGASNGASILVIDDETPDGERIAVTRTEAAAMTSDRWRNVDHRLARSLRDLWDSSLKVQTIVADVVAHADDVDEVPAGTGSCEACSKVVRPTQRNPDNRLRSGLCDACRKHLERSGMANRADWLLLRREMVGHHESSAVLAGRFQSAYSTG